MIKSRRLLDLCCGDGLAAWGYWRSGRFSEIVGVDIDKRKSKAYGFDFVHCDALKLTYDFLLQFDFIHVSPPCQAYSNVTPDKSKHPRLIRNFRVMCEAAGTPFVIENVEGSSQELGPNLVLTAGAVNLPMIRRRYFYVSTLKKPVRDISYPQDYISVHGGDYISREKLIEVFGLTEFLPPHRLMRLTSRGIKQGIPPAMTCKISEMVFRDKVLIG